MIERGEVTAPLWDRLSRFNPLQRRVLIAHLIFLFLTGLAYETFQTDRLQELFTMAIPASIASYFAVFLPLQAITAMIRPGGAKAFFTALFTVAAYLAHSVTLLFLVEPENFAELAITRLPGDITAAITFYWMMVGIVATGIDDLRASTLGVAKARRNLELQRSRRLRAAKEFDTDLRQRIEQSLLGDIKALVAALKSPDGLLDALSISRKIQELVEGKVRPLSKEIASSAESIDIPTATIKLPPKKLLLPRAMPSRDTRAWIVFLIAVPNFFTTALQNSDWVPAVIVSAATLAVPLFNWTIGGLQRDRTVALPTFWLMVTLQTSLAYTPTLFALSFFTPEYPGLEVLNITGLALILIVNLMGSSWGSYFFEQKAQIDLAASINEEISHELDLIDQSLWVVRRRWAYIVHGTVQSALNVAAARLKQGKPDQSIEDALASLESALDSIQSPEQYSRNVKNMLDEIVETWQGVCEFQYQLTPSVLSMLEGKDGPATCLIEISKELVSNANRHGGATKLWLNVYPNNQGDLEVVAGNNGRPIKADAPAGLGVQLFTELTKDFDFEQMKLGGFHATIAMPR